MPDDGNPIYDARSSRLGRAVRIIQTPPRMDDLEIAAWMGTFDSSDRGHTEELTINCALSEESASITRALIREWMDENNSIRDMESIIRDALADIAS
jgi:hypothetical protein